MKQIFQILAVISLGGFPSAHGSTIIFSAAPTARTVVAADGVTPIVGGLVWVGNFGNEGFVFNPALTIEQNVAAITTAGVWRQFSLDTSTNFANSGTSSTLTTSGIARVGGQVVDNNSGATKADFFNAKTLYVWIFDAATPAASTQMGIFKATTASPAWNFPTNQNGVGDVLTLGTTTTTAATTAAVSNVGTTTTSVLRLTSIPEPSSLMLCGVAGLGMLSARHRRRKG